jgi:hypothetical protein
MGTRSMKFLTPKRRVLFAETSWRRAIVHMEISANLHMDLLNSNATRTSRCLIKQDHVMHLKKKGVALMARVATFCITLTPRKDTPTLQLNFEPSSMRLEKKVEAEF